MIQAIKIHRSCSVDYVFPGFCKINQLRSEPATNAARKTGSVKSPFVLHSGPQHFNIYSLLNHPQYSGHQNRPNIHLQDLQGAEIEPSVQKLFAVSKRAAGSGMSCRFRQNMAGSEKELPVLE